MAEEVHRIYRDGSGKCCKHGAYSSRSMICDYRQYVAHQCNAVTMFKPSLEILNKKLNYL